MQAVSNYPLLDHNERLQVSITTIFHNTFIAVHFFRKKITFLNLKKHKICINMHIKVKAAQISIWYFNSQDM